MTVDYSLLNNQYIPSPHTQRDIEFIRGQEFNPFENIPSEDSLLSKSKGDLSMVPNKKALIKLLRNNDFEDLLEIIPHRFSEERYLKKYRVGIIGLKRH